MRKAYAEAPYGGGQWCNLWRWTMVVDCCQKTMMVECRQYSPHDGESGERQHM